MNEEAEKIDSSQMSILSEISVDYENEEEILVPHLSAIKKVYIGVLDNLAIFSSSSKNGVISADLAFEKSNFGLLTNLLEKVLKREFDEQNSESLYRENGKDKLGAGVNSNFPHNLTATFERIYLINLRPLILNINDNLDQGYSGLKLPRKSAQLLLEEMKKLITANKI